MMRRHAKIQDISNIIMLLVLFINSIPKVVLFINSIQTLG